MTSIGGDAFWLIHDARTERGALRSTAAAAPRPAATLDWFASRGLARDPGRGVLPATLTVPGAVDGWCEAHARLRAPAARALPGRRDRATRATAFRSPSGSPRWIERSADVLAADPAAARDLPARGTSPAAGSGPQPEPRAHARAIAADGRAGFYEGETAARWRAARARTAASSPSGDLAAQQRALGRADPRHLSRRDDLRDAAAEPGLRGARDAEPARAARARRSKPFLGPDHVHLLVQAKQIAYHDRDRFVADPRFVDVPIERLLSKAYADERRRLIDPARALPWDRVPVRRQPGRRHGLRRRGRRGGQRGLADPAASTASSARRWWPADTGVVLQNRARLLLARPGASRTGSSPASAAAHADRLARLPRRQLWAGRSAAWAPTASRRSTCRPTPRMIDFGLDIQEAVEAPRWLSGRFALGEARDTLHMEARFPAGHDRRSSRAAATRSTAGATGTSSPATPTASPSIPRRRCPGRRRRSAQRRRRDRVLTEPPPGNRPDAGSSASTG